MRTRPLPRRPSVRLTGLGFGAAQAGNLYRATTDEEFAAAVDTAWAGGLRYFDTAGQFHHQDEEENLFPTLLALDVALAKSARSQSPTLRPRPEASRASPAPLIPPPIIKMSKMSCSLCCIKTCKYKPKFRGFTCANGIAGLSEPA